MTFNLINLLNYCRVGPHQKHAVVLCREENKNAAREHTA